MSVAFWSIAITNKAPKEVEVPEGYVLNLQQAAITGATKGSQVIKVSTVAIDGEKLDAVVATLRPGTVDQTTVSLVFGYDVPVTFTTTGDANGTVYLSGYFQPGPDGDDEDDEDEYGDFDGEEMDEDDEEGSEEDSEEEDGSDDEDEEGNAKNALAAIKKLAAAKKVPFKTNSKGKVEELKDVEISGSDDSEEEDSEDEDDSEDAKDEEFVKKMNAKFVQGKGGKDASDSEEDSEEDDEEDDSEEESDSEESEAPPMKAQKTTPKGTVTPSGKGNSNNNQQKPNTPAAKPSTPAAKAFGGDNNKPKTPQAAPQSANKPNNNQNNNNKTPQNKPNNNHQNNNQKSGQKFPQSGDKRKHGN